MAVGYPLDARPSFQWKHIDGPMLCARNGEMHWLTIRERLSVCLGRDDELSLEAKHFPYVVPKQVPK